MNKKYEEDPLWFLLVKLVIVFIFLIFIILFTKTEANADEASANPYGEPFQIRATCYTWTGNQCADGRYPVQGLTVAGKNDWLGKTAIIYSVNEDGTIGELIGIFEFMDTGYGINVTESDQGSIELGQSIDIYRDTLTECYDWISEYGDYVYIQIVDAKG